MGHIDARSENGWLSMGRCGATVGTSYASLDCQSGRGARKLRWARGEGDAVRQLWAQPAHLARRRSRGPAEEQQGPRYPPLGDAETPRPAQCRSVAWTLLRPLASAAGDVGGGWG